MLAVSVLIEVYPEFIEQFMKAALRHANNTCAKEEGCLGFAVHRHENDPNRFFFYETYRSRKDFDDVHKVAPYLAEYNTLTAPWTKSKEILVWDGVSPDQKT
ncbi:Antibiotic biosynthesis monooxygenase [uncultured delta proteobacterium]|uniref:Antibiotic biosynthesis monooxygenase n=1 Tax=uncultured delta proteobacterium TaxID=34034 RepID=A0A212J7J8_9DELT|nr:Antibiotic biosynthesis monooxygenase [uncultured delta proteobacterium]